MVPPHPRVRVIHVLGCSWWFANLRSLFLFQGCAFLMPSVGSSLAIITAAASTCLVRDLRSVTCFKSLFPLWVVSQLFTSTGIGMSGREDRDPPKDRDDGRGGDGGESGLMTENRPRTGRSAKRATRNIIRDDARLLDDAALVLPTAANGRRTISHSRNPQASELLPGGGLVVNFHDDPRWERSRLFFWLIDATTWIVRTPDGDKYAERFADYSRMRVPLLVEATCPRLVPLNSIVVGLSVSWVSWCEKEEIWPCVRGPPWNWPTIVTRRWCDLSGRLFSVPPVTMGERVRCRIVRKLSFLENCKRLVYGRIEYMFGWVWRLTEWIDGGLVLLLHCQTMLWWREHEVCCPYPTAILSLCKGYLRATCLCLWTGLLTACCFHLVFSVIFVMRPLLWAKTRKLTRPICGTACPFSLRLTKTIPLSENFQMICGPLTDTKPGEISPVRQLLSWPFDGRSALVYMVKHFEKHGGDGLSWLASWSRQKEIIEHERTAIEMRCLVTCLHLSGMYDQLNSPCLASMETVARRVAQIVEA